MSDRHPLSTNGGHLKEKFQEVPTALFGIFLYTGDPSLAEAAAVAGVDFVVIDMEASPMSDRDALSILQSLTGSRCFPVIRVPRHDPHLLGHALDLGAAGVMVPKVETASEARMVGISCRYPPEGTRGLNPLRASAYGKNEDDYVSTANRNLLCVAQIESPAAVEVAKDIAATSAIDALFIGTGDLALTAGIPGDYDHPSLADARRRTLLACADTGTVPGIFAPSAKHAARYAQEGFRMIAVGNEVKLFVAGLSAVLAEVEEYRDI